MTFFTSIGVVTQVLQHALVAIVFLFTSVTDITHNETNMTPPKTAPTPTTWQIDPAHTQVEFTVKHMMFAKVRGSFNEFSGQIEQGANGDLSTGAFSATIQAGTIDTGNGDRDEHLRSADFFDVANFPTITFNSSRIERLADGQLKAYGELTIRDVTTEISLDVTETGTGVDPWGNLRVGIQAEGTISRKEYGLTWNQALEAGGVLVGDEVTLLIEAQAIAQND